MPLTPDPCPNATTWLVEYNTVRPHRGLGMLTPTAYAASITEGPTGAPLVLTVLGVKLPREGG